MSEKPAADYLIWSNQHRAWWRAESAGYTDYLDAAGHYTREEALIICRSAHDGWEKEKVPPEIPVAEADALACAALPGGPRP